MKIHEKITEAKKLLETKTPWHVMSALGNVQLTDHGVWFGKEQDHVTVEEMHEVIAWLIDEFGYKPKKASKK